MERDELLKKIVERENEKAKAPARKKEKNVKNSKAYEQKRTFYDEKEK